MTETSLRCPETAEYSPSPASSSDPVCTAHTSHYSPVEFFSQRVKRNGPFLQFSSLCSSGGELKELEWVVREPNKPVAGNHDLGSDGNRDELYKAWAFEHLHTSLIWFLPCNKKLFLHRINSCTDLSFLRQDIYSNDVCILPRNQKINFDK